jgi:DNA-binding CsgD family transcriptional regulator
MNQDLLYNSRLTENENKVLNLLSEGRTSQQISEELLMPTSQVYRLRISICEKFDVKDEKSAVQKARKLEEV